MRHRPVVVCVSKSPTATRSESLETEPGRARRADVRPPHPTAVSGVNGLQARGRNMVPGVPQQCPKASQVGGHPR